MQPTACRHEISGKKPLWSDHSATPVSTLILDVWTSHQNGYINVAYGAPPSTRVSLYLADTAERTTTEGLQKKP